MYNSTMMDDRLAGEIERVTSKELERNHFSTLTSLVIKNRIPLFQFIESLRDLLTSEETEQRKKGLAAMRYTVESLPGDSISENEVNHLLIFCCDKLNDQNPEYFDQLVPMMCICLQKPNTDRESVQLCLVRLRCILEGCATQLSGELDAILQCLLYLSATSQFQIIRSSSLRITALICQLYDSKKIISHRSHVLKITRSLLDDRKRLVRLAAAESFGRWTMLFQ